MFSLAWLRAFFAFALILLTTSANAQTNNDESEQSIFTSSVTYCNPPETLLISRFEVAYFPQNQSVAFNVSAASVQANVNVTANLMLNVYGMKPVNVTLDLCNILGGALCPLPMYNFTGADTITLPSSIDVAGKIPGIAFTIPDLEGFAQLTLTEVGTGTVKACVQATLANGWSAHQKAVEWTTGGVAIGAAVVSFFVSMLVADALAPFRLLDLMAQYQHIASSALLSLNYPSVYRAFALNFSWALGFVPTSESSAIQNSINSFRHRTGGRLADASQGAAVQFVDRKLSPYNNLAAVSTAAEAVRTTFADIVGRDEISNTSNISTTLSSNLATGFPGGTFLARQTIQGEVQTVTTNSSNVLAAGLPIYVSSVNVSTSNAFMTVFLCALMLFAIGIAVLSLGFVIHFLIRRRKASDSPFDYLAFARAWILRLSLITLFPLLIFIFYQWTLKDSWASILLSVLTLVALLLLIGWPVFSTIRLALTRSEFDLYSPDKKHLQANAPLYVHYRAQRYWFFVIALTAVALRSIFISFARYQAQVQIALMVLVEGLVVIAYIALKPYPTRGGDVFATYLAIVRFVTAVLLIVFLENLAVKPIPRVAIGFVLIALNSVAVVIIIFNFVLNLFTLFVPRILNKGRSQASSGSSNSSNTNSPSDDSTLEKGLERGLEKADSDSVSEVGRGLVERPLNPTPAQSTPVDASMLPPFPVSPTATVTTMSMPSMPGTPGTPYSMHSGTTMTVGSLLPRRWSFQWSAPGSPASTSGHGHSILVQSRRESLNQGPSSWTGSPAGTSEGGFLASRRGSEVSGVSVPPLPGSPSSWKPGTRPGSSNGSSSHGHGALSRKSSAKALQAYQQNHDRISEETRL